MKKIIFLIALLLILPTFIGILISVNNFTEAEMLSISLSIILIVGLVTYFLYVALDYELRKHNEGNPNYNPYPLDNEFYDSGL